MFTRLLTICFHEMKVTVFQIITELTLVKFQIRRIILNSHQIVAIYFLL